MFSQNMRSPWWTSESEVASQQNIDPPEKQSSSSKTLAVLKQFKEDLGFDLGFDFLKIAKYEGYDRVSVCSSEESESF